jgi:Aldehyde dehydrogenase family
VIGPPIDMKAVEKVEAHIADALKKGAKFVTGGKRAAQGGSFFEPTVLTDVTTDMVTTKKETFDPVAPLYRFNSEARGGQDGQRTPHPKPSPARRGGFGWGSPPILQPRDTHGFRLAPTNPEGRSAAARPVDAWLIKGPIKGTWG